MVTNDPDPRRTQATADNGPTQYVVDALIEVDVRVPEVGIVTARESAATSRPRRPGILEAVVKKQLVGGAVRRFRIEITHEYDRILPTRERGNQLLCLTELDL
jgi:hypothetical protein